MTAARRLVRSLVTRSPATAPVTWPFDVGCVVVVVLAIVTRDVVLWFHVIFALLAFAALMFPFRQFAIRLVVGMAISSALVIWAVSSLSTPSEELTELPLLTFVLILIFLVAQSRARAAAENEQAQMALNLRADRDLQNLREQLERSQRLDLLGRTSAGLAHDLRNVFVMIRGCADDLNDASDQRVRDAGSDVSSASDRGLAIIDELLTIGRQHHHGTDEVDLRSAVSDLAPILRRLTRRGVEVCVEVPDRETLVEVDKITVSQILMNLVSNANDAIDGPAGKIVVSAKIVATKDPTLGIGRSAVLSVSDNGGGFDHAALSQAFAAGYTTKGPDHSGLGLATVWQLADRLGGTVHLESCEGRGTSVSVSIPLDRECDEIGPDPVPPGLDEERLRSAAPPVSHG